MSYVESDLFFDFPKHWIVKKYDQHPFYKGMSGVGLSAVDFIVVTQEDAILLIEVKNYCHRPASQLFHINALLRNHEEGLAYSFIQKLEETITGINAIATYCSKSAWYRAWYILLKKVGAKYFLLSNDRLCWLWLNEQIQQTPEKIVPILWLELPDHLAQYQIELQASIVAQMRASKYAVPQIWNLSNHHPFLKVTPFYD
jgi:hypothetical protein